VIAPLAPEDAKRLAKLATEWPYSYAEVRGTWEYCEQDWTLTEAMLRYAGQCKDSPAGLAWALSGKAETPRRHK
jgi:hypothetical protein